MREGSQLSLDPNTTNAFCNEERQSRSVVAMGNAYFQNINSQDPMEEAALSIELDFTIRRCGDLSKLTVNETVIMVSQRWLITVLPIHVVEQVVHVALIYRNALREYLPLMRARMPNNQTVFPHFLSEATEENRPDIVALLGTLLKLPDHINCHVYSEPDQKIMTAWRGFQRSPEANVLTELPESASANEIIEYLGTRAGIMDPTICFWCEKSVMNCSGLMLCAKCKKTSYCSKECQLNDWKACHRAECKKLVKGKTPDDLGMSCSRNESLRLVVFKKPLLHDPVAPAEDSNSVWRGDALAM